MDLAEFSFFRSLTKVWPRRFRWIITVTRSVRIRSQYHWILFHFSWKRFVFLTPLDQRRFSRVSLWLCKSKLLLPQSRITLFHWLGWGMMPIIRRVSFFLIFPKIFMTDKLTDISDLKAIPSPNVCFVFAFSRYILFHKWMRFLFYCSDFGIVFLTEKLFRIHCY
jgi:hypothetical protein